MAADPKELREFEVWARIKFHSTVLGRLNGRYANPTVEHAWQGWLARSAVPNEITEPMVEAGARAICRVGADRWHKLMPHTQKAFLNDARACLTAALTVSQPTSDAMISATTDRGEG